MPDSTPPPGVPPKFQVLGEHYRLMSKLGEGAFGEVYLANHTLLDQEFAVKVLKPELCEDEDVRHRFLDEARALIRFSHPNVVQLRHVGEHGNRLYLVMDLVRGRPLDEVIRDDGAFSEERALTVMAQVLSGLESAHAAGIIHRDLKPSNLILESRPGTTELVRILDFGLSKLASIDGAKSSHRSMTGTIIGTLAYMSPEQLKGDRDIDARSDVFAAGLLLQEMLQGEHPYPGESGIVVAAKLLRDPMPPLKIDQATSVSASTRAALATAVERDRDARYASVTMFADALAGKGPPSDTSRIATIEEAQRELARQEALAGGASAKQAERTATLAVPKTKKSSMLPMLLGLLVLGGAGAAWSMGLFDGKPPVDPSTSTADVPTGQPADPVDRLTNGIDDLVGGDGERDPIPPVTVPVTEGPNPTPVTPPTEGTLPTPIEAGTTVPVTVPVTGPATQPSGPGNQIPTSTAPDPATQPGTTAQPGSTDEPASTTSPEQPTTSPEQPTTTPEQPTTPLEQPTTPPEQPTTTPQQPTTTPAQPVLPATTPRTQPEPAVAEGLTPEDCCGQAGIALGEQKFSSARALYLQALKVPDTNRALHVGALRGAALSWLGEADVRARKGDISRGLALLEEVRVFLESRIKAYGQDADDATTKQREMGFARLHLAETHTALARWLTVAGKSEEARTHLKPAADSFEFAFPMLDRDGANYAEFLIRRGDFYRLLGKLQEHYEDLKRTTKTNNTEVPPHAWVLHARGARHVAETWWNKNDQPQARQWADRAVDVAKRGVSWCEDKFSQEQWLSMIRTLFVGGALTPATEDPLPLFGLASFWTRKAKQAERNRTVDERLARAHLLEADAVTGYLAGRADAKRGKQANADKKLNAALAMADQALQLRGAVAADGGPLPVKYTQQIRASILHALRRASDAQAAATSAAQADARNPD